MLVYVRRGSGGMGATEGCDRAFHSSRSFAGVSMNRVSRRVVLRGSPKVDIPLWKYE